MEYQHLSDFDKYKVARWAYSVGQPIISDAEYNILDRVVKELYPNAPICSRSWSSDPCPSDLLISIGRQDLMKTIILGDKTESIPSLNSEFELVSALGNINELATLSYKHDGWNVQANYYNGELVNVQTRGRATDAVDVSGLKSKVPERIPYQGKCKAVMELTVGKRNFKVCKELFGNVSERSAVSSVLARPEYYHLLDMHAFDLHGAQLTGNKFVELRKIGFNTPQFIEVNNFDELKRALQTLSDQEVQYDSPTDGAVYDGSIRRAIRLLTWEEPIYYSYVIGYIEQYGPHRISPSVMIKPIMRKGTTQRKLSLTNWPRIMNYNLQPGAPIAFRIASSAIADFDEESTRLIHARYEGRWEEFRAMIDKNEEMALWKMQ